MSDTPTATLNEALCQELLKDVYDPEMGVNVVDLGLIRGIDIQGSKADVSMTLTSPACPAGPQIVQQIKGRLQSLKQLDDVHVTLVWDPPWTPEEMSEDAKDQLGIF